VVCCWLTPHLQCRNLSALQHKPHHSVKVTDRGGVYTVMDREMVLGWLNIVGFGGELQAFEIPVEFELLIVTCREVFVAAMTSLHQFLAVCKRVTLLEKTLLSSFRLLLYVTIKPQLRRFVRCVVLIFLCLWILYCCTLPVTRTGHC